MADNKSTGKNDKNFPILPETEAPTYPPAAEKNAKAADESKPAEFQADPVDPEALARVEGPTYGTADGRAAAAKLKAAEDAGGQLQKDADDAGDDPDFYIEARGKTGWDRVRDVKVRSLEGFKAEADKLHVSKKTDVRVMNKYGSEVYLGKPPAKSKAVDSKPAE